MTFYDENGLHKAGTVTKVNADDFNALYMKKIDTPSESTELSELDDVDISGVADGEILKYDAATEKWVNGQVSGGGIPYVEATEGGTSSAKVHTATISGITEYYNGLTILAKLPSAGTSSTSLNVNNLGAKTIKFTGSTGLSNVPNHVGDAFLLTYENNYWLVINSDVRGQIYQNYNTNGQSKLHILCSSQTSTFSGFGYAHRNKDVNIVPSTGTLEAKVLECTSFGTNATAAIKAIIATKVTLTDAYSQTPIQQMDVNASGIYTISETIATILASDIVDFQYDISAGQNVFIQGRVIAKDLSVQGMEKLFFVIPHASGSLAQYEGHAAGANLQVTRKA